MIRVPFVDLYQQHQEVEAELVEVFQRVLRKSSFILGPEVQTFERSFASYVGSAECIAVNSGTAALQLVLLGLDIGPGHEVITVPNTFIATAEAISAVGARPVFVDVDPVSYDMDPAQVEAAITPRTAALLPVICTGRPPILGSAEHRAAPEHPPCGGRLPGSRGYVQAEEGGSVGIAGCFSFYPGKNLGCLGEGGAIVTNDADLAQRMRILRDHGSIRKYEHRVPGYNFRLEGLQGGFLSVKLRHLDSWNERRRAAAKRYNELLSDSGLTLPAEMPYGEHVYHLYVIQADDREALRQQLSSAGIETGLHYPVPLHLQEAYASLGYSKGSFPVSERLTDRILSLPMHPGISDEQIQQVASVVLEYCNAQLSIR